MPSVAAIALGSNLGDRAGYLRAALDALGRAPGVSLLRASPMYETAPVGPVLQGRYLNAAAVLQTDLSPRALLDLLQRIERSHGRLRSAEQRWGPRTLDLDLLLFDRLVLDGPGLSIPHPGLRRRAFVLVPLADVGPDLAIPETSAGPATSVAEALADLRATGGVAPGCCTLYAGP